MTNMKPKLTTKLRHISRAAPKRVIALVLTFLFAFNAASVLEAFPAYAEGESQTAGESTVQTSEPTASVTNDDLQISGSNSFGNLLATKVNDYQNGGDEDEYTEGYSVIGIEMNGKTSVVEYRAKDDCSLVVAVYDDDGIKMLCSGNTTVAANKQSAEVEISIDEMPQDYLVKAFLVNPANNYPLCDAFSKTFPVIEEPTEDLPELYTPDGDNIAYASEENFYYMNNMVIIVFADDAQQSEIDSVIASINGKAVGKNKYINQYQVEIATHSLDELRDIITQVESNECVLFAHYDQVLANSENSISLDDPWDGNVDNEDWNDSDVDGSNWWLEAIDAPGAWEYNDFFSKIKIGIIDSGFDTGHEDIDVTVCNASFNSKDDHGTHVAGIIGANHNNGKGITGIVWNKELLCYDWEPTQSQTNALNSISPGWTTSTYIYSGLICEVSAGAKVINFSVGRSGNYPNGITYSQVENDTQGEIASGYMARLLSNPDLTDFVVVQSAGNGGVDAINNGLFASVTQNNCVDWGTGRASKQNILNRILIVGAVQKNGSGYMSSVFSNGGNQENIAAPGGDGSRTSSGDIRSTITTDNGGYDNYPGTSMAAPMVTGVAALVWSVNPTFTGAEVANIVKTRTSLRAIDNPESTQTAGTPPIVNARLAVEEAMNRTHYSTGKCGDNITYTLYETGLLELNGSGDMYNYNNNTTGNNRKNPPWFDKRTEIKKVIFNGNITSIGDCAFFEFTKLTSIDIPNSIITINEAAFMNCNNLANVIIPDSVISIEGNAFYKCTNLISIKIPDSVTAIGQNAFGGCENLETITIPNSVTSIGMCIFSGCFSLKSVTLSSKITLIPISCFINCTGLTDVVIPISVTEIADNAFNNCCSLSSIIIPNSVTSIQIGVFSRCKKLSNITMPNSLTYIGKQAFSDCSSLKTITIPKSVTTMGEDAFLRNNITDVYYGGSIEDWERIRTEGYSLWSFRNNLSHATIHYNSTGPSSSPSPMRSPDASGALSASFDNLIPNANYLFVVSKSSDLGNMLDASNLLFIDEKAAGDSGSLTFGYIPREDYEGAVVKIIGPVNPSVTLDKTSATLKKGDKLTLTAMVDQEHSASDVGWASSNTGIATVSDSGEVTAVGFGDVEIIATLDDCAVKCLVSIVPELDFTILGASIRLIEPYGIRFGIQLGKGGDYANVKIVDYGTIMKPTELLDGEDLTLETGNVQKIPAKVIYSENDAMKIYTGVLINILTTYFDTAISGRGYFIYEDENGVNHTVYTDIVSMSFNDVVNAAYQKYTSLPNLTDAQKEIIARLEVLRAMSVND